MIAFFIRKQCFICLLAVTDADDPVLTLIVKESLYRFGKYFAGYMGAAAIQKRLQDFDLTAETVVP